MRVFGNDITVQRGEQFALDFFFTNKDGSPFLVSSEMTYPYYLISVVSNVFDTGNVYEYNVWCDLRNTYRFYNTTAVSKDGAVNSWTEPSDFDDYKQTGIDGYTYYTGCIFYSTVEDKYYMYKYNGTQYTYVDVSTMNINRLVTEFSTEVTSKWNGQNYIYAINLVETESAVSTSTDSPVIISSIPIVNKGIITVLEKTGGNN